MFGKLDLFDFDSIQCVLEGLGHRGNDFRLAENIDGIERCSFLQAIPLTEAFEPSHMRSNLLGHDKRIAGSTDRIGRRRRPDRVIAKSHRFRPVDAKSIG